MGVVKPVKSSLRRAAAAIRQARLVAFPTETVYGLGALAGSPRAVLRLYAAKGRPRFNPLIAHVATAGEAHRLVRFDDRAELLARHFWPGPLTMVLPRLPGAAVSRIACAGLPTLGVRVPDHPVALALLRAAGRPIVAPSANPSGRLSPTRAGDVARTLGGRVTMVLDGGPCRVGLESTIVDLTCRPARLLRPGGIAREAIERLIGRLDAAGGAIIAPGMLESHYAPRARLRLRARSAEAGEAFLGFGQMPPLAPEIPALNLSPNGDLTEAAHNLFSFLQTLDRPHVRTIAVAPIPTFGVGLAIQDRLARAAAPR
ncbi:MAG: threonylcarbamoyl-AMP synthase [Alphaproteobacteria bacterium]|nr:threonylcarbamoyl-AMP synthase [Alphaproteobacteria bacterium]